MTVAASTRPRPQTGAERNRRWRARKRAAAAADRAIKQRRETGRWPPTADGVCAWAEAELKVPTGPHQGEPIRLEDFQRDFIGAIVGGSYRELGLSISRKNAKSMTASIVVLAYLAGPLCRPRWRGLVCSLTGRHAMEIREMVRQLAASSPALEAVIEVRAAPAPGYILGKLDTRLDLLASDKASGHAVGGDLVLFDELGLIEEPRRPLLDALYTAMSAADGVMVAISIRGHGPFMPEIEARAKSSKRVWWREYAASPTASVDDRAAWAAANPGLGRIKSESYMADAAERAIASGSEGNFRAYDLNAPVQSEVDALVPLQAWMDCEAHDAPPPTGDCVLGIDLGGSRSMTAVCIAQIDEPGALFIRGAFPADPDLYRRGKADACGDFYRRCWELGELRVYPGRGGVPVREFVADVLAELGELNGGEYAIRAVGSDRYRKMESHAALAKFGPVEWRGVGAGADGCHDVRATQAQIMGESVVSRPSRLLQMAIGQSVLRYDKNGNPALEKSTGLGRIDAASATVIALGLRALARDNGEAAKPSDMWEMTVG